MLAIVDGRNILILPPCRDHKRLGDDTGPNTGGIGTFCPSENTLTPDVMETVEREDPRPDHRRPASRRNRLSRRALRRAHAHARGPQGPRVHTRRSRVPAAHDPPQERRGRAHAREASSIRDVEWSDQPACCVVLAAKGYPDKPHHGDVITGLDLAEKLPGVSVFHAEYPAAKARS